MIGRYDYYLRMVFLIQPIADSYYSLTFNAMQTDKSYQNTQIKLISIELEMEIYKLYKRVRVSTAEIKRNSKYFSTSK